MRSGKRIVDSWTKKVGEPLQIDQTARSVSYLLYSAGLLLEEHVQLDATGAIISERQVVRLKRPKTERCSWGSGG